MNNMQVHSFDEYVREYNMHIKKYSEIGNRNYKRYLHINASPFSSKGIRATQQRMGFCFVLSSELVPRLGKAKSGRHTGVFPSLTSGTSNCGWWKAGKSHIQKNIRFWMTGIMTPPVRWHKHSIVSYEWWESISSNRLKAIILTKSVTAIEWKYTYTFLEWQRSN
jgi:hypothetical protein